MTQPQSMLASIEQLKQDIQKVQQKLQRRINILTCACIVLLFKVK